MTNMPQTLFMGMPHAAVPGAAPMVMPQVPVSAEHVGAVNNTIYINNLNEKIKRDELKKSLYAVFVQFGQIMDIITAKRLKMRGQAFVVFEDSNSASAALRAMQGFPLYEKPMRIQFAKSDSDVIAKRKGTYVARPKVVAAQVAAQAAVQAVTLDQAGGPQGGTSARAIRRRQQRAALAALAASGTAGVHIPPPEQFHSAIAQQAPPQPPPINPATIPDQPPNKILFLTNLPEDSDETMLGMLFNQFPGYCEVRMVSGRHDIAFVEFGNETEAGAAKHGLQGFTIRPGKPIRITFAKK